MNVPVLEISHYQWSSDYKPYAYGRMAYLDNQGLLVHMVSEENNPLRRYTEDDDPVYRDSALEFFVSFSAGEKTYINIEVNALGAVLYGYGKDGLKYKLADVSNLKPEVSVNRGENSWEVEMFISEPLIQNIFEIDSIQPNSRFSCNLYKISEEAEIEHYGSWSRIDSDVPNFHLPQFFGRVIIED